MAFWQGFLSLFNKKSIAPSAPIKEAFGVESAVSGRMEQNINLWWSMYVNDAPWQNENVRTLGLPAAICREIVRPSMSEYEVTAKGSTRGTYLNQRVQQAFMKHIRWNLEHGLAIGGIAFKPYFSSDELWIDASNAGTFTPTHFDEMGRAVGGVFRDHKKYDGNWYIRLEYHDLNGTDYTIRNKAYKSDSSGTVKEKESVQLAIIPAWAGLQPLIEIANVERPLFAYFKAPQTNNVEPSSDVGISVYGGATAELIKQADEMWDAYYWEFKSAERKVLIDSTTTNIEKYSEDRKYEFIPFLDRTDPFHEFSPDVRGEEFYSGFQNILKQIEFNVGLSFGTISDPQTVDKTATEIQASKQRMYQLIEDILKELDYTVETLVYALDVYATIYQTAPAGSYTVETQHGDAILQSEDDWKREMDSMRMDVSASLIRPEIYIAKKYNTTEEQALKMMPDMVETVEGAV